MSFIPNGLLSQQQFMEIFVQTSYNHGTWANKKDIQTAERLWYNPILIRNKALAPNIILFFHHIVPKEKKRKTRTHDSLPIAHNICQLYNKWGYSKIQPNIFFEHRNVSRILRSKLFIWPPKTSILPSQLLLYAGHCIITTFIILPQILLPDFTGIFQSSCLFLVIFLLLPDFNKIFQSRCPFLVIFYFLRPTT